MDAETTNSNAAGGISIEAAVRELGDRVALIKAHIVGQDRVADSNAMPWTDVDQREQVFAGMGVVTPPYDPETLAILFENSSSLRQNVDAYVTNIDAFGHRFEPVIDLDASDVDHRIANALLVERQRRTLRPEHGEALKPTSLAPPTPEEVAAKKAEVTEHMRLERSRLETFFDFCCVDLSFVTLRRRTRQDIEVMGNGYWEVLRDGGDEIAQFVYLPSFTMRLLPLDLALVEVDINVKISEISFDTMKVRRRFRRYVQVFEQQVVYFKEFGDPRVLSRKRGMFFSSLDELLASDATDGPATEILHFKLHNPRSAYGTPRWVGNLLSVLGTRQAEEVNFLFFENKSVPPLAILVSGGRLSAQSIPRLESFIETHIKGKRNFHRVLILEAEPAGSGGGLEHTGRMKIELRPLTGAQQSDALFQNYDERNHDKVGQSFRLPRLLRGDIRDFNRSTGDAALMFAEMQVFQPEREEFDFVINRKVLADMGIRFWKLRSNSPVTRDPAAMADIVRGLVNANILTPEEGRMLASDVFNREFKKISASWVKQPVPLTLAGIPPTPEPESTLVGPEVQKGDATTCDLAAAGGQLGPAQGLPGRRGRRGQSFDLVGEATRLIAIRNALRDAEAGEAARDFHQAKRAELEREVVTVPAAELASWFEKESTP
jgi:PBSX family phage portal protein